MRIVLLDVKGGTRIVAESTPTTSARGSADGNFAKRDVVRAPARHNPLAMISYRTSRVRLSQLGLDLCPVHVIDIFRSVLPC